MNYRWAVIFYIAAFFLQTAVTGVFPVAGVSANLLLCVSVAIAFSYSDDTSALVFGAVFSLVYDISMTGDPGMSMLALCVTVALTIAVRERVLNNENRFSMLIVSAGSVIVYYNLYWLCVRAAGYNTAYMVMLSKMHIYLLLNMPVMLVLYFFFIRSVVSHNEERYNRWVSS